MSLCCLAFRFGRKNGLGEFVGCNCVQSNMDGTFFIYDCSAVQSESDDPLLAVKYFVSHKHMDSGEKCMLCGSLVTLYESVATITGSPPRKITLQSQVFAVERAENQIMVGLSCTVESKQDPVTFLDQLIEIVKFRYSTFSASLQLWPSGEIGDDLVNILTHTEKLCHLENDFEIQMKCKMFMDHCLEYPGQLGLCVLCNDKIVHSHFDQKTSKLILAASLFSNPDGANVITSSLSSLTWFTVYLLKNSYKDIESLAVNEDCEATISDLTDPSSDIRNRVPLILACLCVNHTTMFIMCTSAKFESRVAQGWEKELANLDDQLAKKILSEDDEYF